MIFEDEPVPGYPLPILPGHTSPGRLERVLRAGGFAVTAELAPPDSADPEDVYRRARVFDGYVDAINATDGSGANCHMSSLAVCALLTRVGYAPIMQISCRDRNRIAIQGDILGGAAMGVCNILCLTGDGVQAGDHPQAKPVFDLDCISLLDDRAHAARRASFPERPQDHLRAARVPGRRRKSVRAAVRVARAAAGQESRRRRAVHPDPVLLRRAAAARTSWRRSRNWASSARPSFWSASGRCARPRRPSGCARTCRACTSRTRSSSGSTGAQDQAREGRNICIELIQEIREIAASAACMSWPTARRSPSPRSSSAPACSRAACPGIPERDTVKLSQQDTHHDRHRHQLGHPGSRHRLRPPVRHDRRAHQSHRAQDPGGRNGGGRFHAASSADALAQVAAGAHMLDVNAGIPLADEPAILAQTIQLVQSITDVPLSIDSSIVAALEAGLAVYKGKALVNSVTGEEERLESRAAAGEEVWRGGGRDLQRRDRHLRRSGRAFRGREEDRRARGRLRHSRAATSWSIRW